MSNLFQEVSSDSNLVEEKSIGSTYPYYTNIKTPSQIGMSDTKTNQQMSNDTDVLIQYVNLLVNGKSNASSMGDPLGNKFFLKTGAKCADVNNCKNPNDASTCEQTDRFIYINNVPQGDIPFISSGIGKLNVLNPFAIMRAFISEPTPPCQEITMQTIDINNNKSSETHYVTLVDIQNIDPCTFNDRINPVTKAKCRETFQTGVAANASPVMSDDIIDQVYFASLAGLGIYILYRIMEKSQ